jgi:hypothetical protein
MLFMASFHMEGRAITWFQEMEETRALTSYELFVKAIQIQLEISSHAMVGGLNPKTMRVKARINSHFLVFVIDTRSTRKHHLLFIGSVIVVAFQIAFRAKIHANDVFSFFKNHF